MKEIGILLLVATFVAGVVAVLTSVYYWRKEKPSKDVWGDGHVWDEKQLNQYLIDRDHQQ